MQAADSGFGFVADWSADFGAAGANGDGPAAPAAAESAGWPAAEASPAAGLDEAQAWHTAGGLAEQEPEDSAAASPSPPPAAEAPLQPMETAASTTSAAPIEVSGPAPDPITNPHFDFIGSDVALPQGGGPTHPTGAEEEEEEEGEEQGGEEWEEEREEEELVASAAGGSQTGEVAGQATEDRRKSTPGLIITNEHGEEIEDRTEDRGAHGWRPGRGGLGRWRRR